MTNSFVEIPDLESLYSSAQENKPQNEYQHILNLDITPQEEERLGHGSEGYINRIRGKLGRREIILAQKFLASPENAFAQRAVYLIAKRAGLPVPETFKPSTHGIVMSDLTENGSALVISVNDLTWPKLESLRHDYPELMQVFDTTDISALEKIAESIGMQAMRAGLECKNNDCLFLIIKKTEPAKLIIGDFGNVKESKNPQTFQTTTFIRMCRASQHMEADKNPGPFWER